MLKSLKLELTAAIALLISTPVTAAPLENWRFDPNTNQLEVTVPAGITPRYSLLAQPARIVLDLPDTQVGGTDPRGTYSGAVREVRVSQFQPNVARIVLELAPNVVLGNQQAQLQQVKDSDQMHDRWTLRPVFVASAPSPKTQAVFNALRPIQTAPTQTNPIAQSSNPAQTNSIAQSSSDFGLPPAPPTIDAVPSVTAPDLPAAQSSPLPIAPAVMPPLQPIAPLPAAGSGSSPGSSLLFPDAPIRSNTTSNPLQLPEVNPSLAIPNSFPPINAPAAAQPTVTVPQLDRRSASQEPRSTTLPVENTPVPARSRTIEFGQPLPTLSN
ncbi:MAG: AMIN domain-containing protein [Phormidium tanganyikae FI6-MK23]|jgi:hypothetical protein|nr:AMIN domain-containing protein [Phormidium tanganyikae FI6-MK23]